MTFTFSQIAFGSILGAWFVLTVLFQFPRLQKAIRAYDCFYMLPSWSFFAPVPSTSDHIVLLRFENRGELTPWKLPHLISLPQIPLLWDPERRQRKTLIDIVHSIGEFTKLSSLKDIHLATPYLMLIQFASMQPETLFATGVQIMICARPAGQQNYELSFNSNLHTLQPQPPSHESHQ
jgi:hypothetical protein